MSAELSPCLRTEDGARVPLTGVSASGRLDGLLFELAVEQHYRNISTRPSLQSVMLHGMRPFGS